MLRHIIIICITSLLFTTPAQAQWYKDWLQIFEKGQEGAGTLKEQIYELTQFSGVHLDGSSLLIIQQGRKASLTIKSDANLLEYLTPHYEAGILKLKASKKVKPTQGIVYILTTPDVQSLSVSGSGTIETTGFETQNLTLTINGSGNIKLNQLSVDNLSTIINGSGDCHLSGEANNQSITVRGTGDLDAKELKTNQSAVIIYGSGKVYVNTDKALDVKIYGTGDVYFTGEGKLSQNIYGSGNIQAL